MIACLYAYSSVLSFDLTKYFRFEQKLPHTFNSHGLCSWIADLKSPKDLYPHQLLWSLQMISEAKGGKKRRKRLASCIQQFFNPVDLAMGEVMSKAGFGTNRLVLKDFEVGGLCIQLACLVESSVT